MVESNEPTSHQVTVRTGLPAVYWRAYNQGVPSSKVHHRAGQGTDRDAGSPQPHRRQTADPERQQCSVPSV